MILVLVVLAIPLVAVLQALWRTDHEPTREPVEVPVATAPPAT